MQINIQTILKKEKTPFAKIDKTFIVYIFIILLACIKQLFSVKHHLDLPFFDESIYLKKGIFLDKHAFNDWGPSYNLWYYLINKISRNAVHTFYINYCLLMTLIPILIFILLNRLKIQKNIALLFTLLFLMQPMLSVNFTFVSHFCLIIILTAFILITYQKENQPKIIIAFTAAYICMYARQEFLLIAISLLVIYVVVVIKDKKLNWNISIIVLCFTVTTLYFIFGFISFKVSGIDRSYFAFIQHFYVNYSIWTKKLLPLEQFKALDIFHGSKTMLQCLFSEPPLFFKHMATNFLNYFVILFKYLENFILPTPIFHYLGKLKHVLFLVLVIYFMNVFLKNDLYKNLSSYIQNYTLSSLLMFVFFGWSFFSIFFIFPERHYIILQFIWWILIISIMVGNNTFFTKNMFVYSIIIIILLIFIPTSKSIGYFHNAILDAKYQPNLKTVKYLQQNNDHKTNIIFTSETGFEAYLPSNYHECFIEVDSLKPYKRNNSIDILKYFLDKKINIIYMNEKMQNLIKGYLGEIGDAILNRPESIGYRKQIIDKRLCTYLLIKIE